MQQVGCSPCRWPGIHSPAFLMAHPTAQYWALKASSNPWALLSIHPFFPRDQWIQLPLHNGACQYSPFKTALKMACVLVEWGKFCKTHTSWRPLLAFWVLEMLGGSSCLYSGNKVLAVLRTIWNAGGLNPDHKHVKTNALPAVLCMVLASWKSMTGKSLFSLKMLQWRLEW